MSLWRSKRRYDTGRRFTDQADDALYALALLQSDETAPKDRASELREKLEHGKTVLKTLRNALKNPEEADNYTYSVARQLKEHYGDIDKFAIERLDRHIDHLDTAKASLSYNSNLDNVVEALEVIEELTAQTTDQEAEQMRDYVANSNS